MARFTQEGYIYPSQPGTFVNMVEFSSTGRHYATVTNNNCVKIFDANTHRFLTTCKPFKLSVLEPSGIEGNTYIHDIAFSEGGTRLAAAAGKEILIWKTYSGGKINRLYVRNYYGVVYFKLVCFSKSNEALAAASDCNKIYVFSDYRNHPDEYEFFYFDIHDAPITSLKYFRRKCNILSCDDIGQCIKWDSSMWNYNPNRIKFPDIFPNVKIVHSVISSDYRYVLLTHLNSFVTSWKVISDGSVVTDQITLYRTYSAHDASTLDTIKANLWYTRTFKFVIAGSENCQVYIWDFYTARLIKRLYSPGYRVITLHAIPQPHSNKLMLLQENGRLAVWKFHQPK